MVILIICIAIIAWLDLGFMFYMKLAKEEVASGHIFEFGWGGIFNLFGTWGFRLCYLWSLVTCRKV